MLTIGNSCSILPQLTLYSMDPAQVYQIEFVVTLSNFHKISDICDL